MQTSNRLLYCKGGSPVRKGQYGDVVPKVQGVGIEEMQPLSTFDPSKVLENSSLANQPKIKKPGSGMGMNLMGAGVDAALNLIPQKDAMSGAVEKGLDPTELQQVQNTGKGFGTAGKALSAAGDVAGMIPGPWGQVAKIGLNLLGKGANLIQGNKQDKVIDQMALANADRKFDSEQMNNRAMMGQAGGLLYKKPNKVLSLVSGGGIYEDGGKAPEMQVSFSWDYPFKVTIPETTMERKKSVKIFKRGGKFDNPDKTNVIVTGSRHHEHNRLGDKGVPVIDKTGEKVFEVEKGELILTKDATNKIEALFEKYKTVEVDDDKAHDVLKTLGKFFTDEMKENLYDYENNAI